MSRIVYNAPAPANVAYTNVDNNFSVVQAFQGGVKTADITAVANVIALHASSSVGIDSPELAIAGTGPLAIISTPSDNIQATCGLGAEIDMANETSIQGTLTTNALKTASAQIWDLGGEGIGVGLLLVTNKYITVTIGGTAYKLALVTV